MGLVLGYPEVMGFGVVQLEQQEKRPAAGEFAPEENRIAFKDSGHVGNVMDVVAEVTVPRGRIHTTKRWGEEANDLVDGGLHKSAGQNFWRLAFYPAARSRGIVDEIFTILFNKTEKSIPFMEAVVVDVQPKVESASGANVKPETRSPNVLLRTRTEADFG